MHRLIITSTTYRQSSQVTPENQRLTLTERGSRVPTAAHGSGGAPRHAHQRIGKFDDTPFGSPDHVDSREDGLVTSWKQKEVGGGASTCCSGGVKLPRCSKV